MSKKKIEIVCLGNNGRSPIIETVLKYESHRRGLNQEIDITSSGLYVNRRLPFKLLIKVMEMGVNSPAMNIYGVEESDVRKILDNPDTKHKYERDLEFRKHLEYLADQSYRPLQAMDIAFRDNVLARFGLQYTRERHQFPYRDDNNYVFTATRKLVKPAGELMSGQEALFSLGEFTGTEDIEGGFGQFSIEFYERLTRDVKEISPILLERVLENEMA